LASQAPLGELAVLAAAMMDGSKGRGRGVKKATALPVDFFGHFDRIHR